MALAAFWYLRQNSDADAYALASRGEVLAQQGQLAEARTALREAIAIRDDVSEFHMLLGRVNYQLQDLPGAFVAFDFARSLSPDNTEAQLAVAQIGLQIGEFEKSKEAARQLLLRNPTFVEARVVRGVNLMVDRKFDEAVEAADDVLEDQPDHEQAIVLRIRATLLSGREEEARELSAQYAASVPRSVPLALTDLEVYRELSDADGMIATFDRLRDLVPQAAHLQADEAALYYKLGQDARATRLAMDALTFSENTPEEISALVRLLRLFAPTPLILDDIDRISREGSDDVRLEMAQLLIARGEIGLASDLAAGATGPQAAVVRGLALLASRKTGEARSVARDVLETDEGNCLARYIQASVLVREAKYREGVYEAQYAVNECPTLLEAWNVLADAYEGLGRQEQVARIYRQGIAANPQEPALVDAYVAWLLKKDRSREALAARRTLARAMPSHVAAWEKYAEMCRTLQPSCVATANTGLERSRGMYGIDPPPGERATAGLFGRFLIR